MIKGAIAALILVLATSSLAGAEDDEAFEKAVRLVEDMSIVSLYQEHHHLQLSEADSMRLIGGMVRRFWMNGISPAETERVMKQIYPTSAGDKGDAVFKQRYSSRYNAYNAIISMSKHPDASQEEAKIFDSISDQICLAKKAEFLK